MKLDKKDEKSLIQFKFKFSFEREMFKNNMVTFLLLAVKVDPTYVVFCFTFTVCRIS